LYLHAVFYSILWLKNCLPGNRAAAYLADKASDDASPLPTSDPPTTLPGPIESNVLAEGDSVVPPGVAHQEFDLSRYDVHDSASGGEDLTYERAPSEVLPSEVPSAEADAQELARYHSTLQEAYLSGCEGFSTIPTDVLRKEAAAALHMSALYKIRRGANETLTVSVGGRERQLCAFHYRGGDSPTTAKSSIKFCYAERMYFGNDQYTYFRWDPLSACSTSAFVKGNDSTGAGTRTDRTYYSMCKLRHSCPLYENRFVLLQIMMTLCASWRFDFMIYDSLDKTVVVLKGNDFIKTFWCTPETPIRDAEYDALREAQYEYLVR
jgi:hypothetical protein